jgi:fibronectin-binding autotransporter adhesin
MRSSIRTIGIAVLVVVLAAGWLTRTAWASSYTWTGNDGSPWSDTNNWGGLAIPGSSDTALFGNASLGAVPVSIGTGVSVQSVVFGSTANYPSGTTIGSPNDSGSITLGAGGSIISTSGKPGNAFGGTETINRPLTLLGSATFTNNNNNGAYGYPNSSPIILNGAISGTGAITINSTQTSSQSQVTLGANNAFTLSGNITVISAQLYVANGGALGNTASPVTFNGGLLSYGNVGLSKPFIIAANSTATGGNNYDMSGAVTINPGVTFTVNTGGGNAVSLSSPISGGSAANLQITDPNLTLKGSAANTLSGTTLITATSGSIAPGGVTLAKTVGVDAVAGPLVLTQATAGKFTMVQWTNSNQINDNSTVTMNSNNATATTLLRLNGQSDAIAGLIASGIGSSIVESNAAATSVLGLVGTGNYSFNGYLRNSLAGTGTLALVKDGIGTQVFNGILPFTNTGSVTINRGTLVLAMSNMSTPTNLLNPVSPLMLAGGTLYVQGAAGVSSQSFSSGVTLNAGASTVTADGNGGAGATIGLGTVTRNTGGVVDFNMLSAGGIAITNANTSGGILGGWATSGGTTWAVSAGDGSNAGAITPLASGSYTADTWGAGNNTDVQASAGTQGSVGSSVSTNSLRFNTAGAVNLTLADSGVVSSGGILVTPNAGPTNIGGGPLQGPSGGELVFIQNSGGNMTVDASIVDNGGATGLTKAGSGTLVLTNSSNTYSGPTNIAAGTLNLSGTIGMSTVNVLNAGTLAGPGAVTGNATINGYGTINLSASGAIGGTLTVNGGGNWNGQGTVGGLITVNSGTFTMGSGGTLSANGGMTVAAGALAAADSTAAINIGNTLTYASSSSSNFAGILTGSGNLTVNNSAFALGVFALPGSNTYTGVTTLQAGTLKVNVLANGGLPSGIGQSSNDPANLVFAAPGGTLQYSGASVSTDRGMTLNASTTGTVNVDTGTLTLAGTLTGGGSLTKSGSGMLVLSNTSNNNGGNLFVAGGTLQLGAGVAISAGTQTSIVGVATPSVYNPGAFLDLNGNTETIGALGTFTNGTILSSAAGGQLILAGTSASTMTATGRSYVNVNVQLTDSSGTAAVTRTFNATNGIDLLTLSGSLTEGAGTASVTTGGSGVVVFSGTNGYTGTTTISGGALRATEGTSLPTASNLKLNGGVLESSGTFNRSLGTASGQVQWTGNGGFSANGGQLTVLLNNNNDSPLVWNGTASFLASGNLVFGSSTANAQTLFQNDFSLNNASRTITVNAGLGGDYATLSGVVSGGTLTKNGTGILVLTNGNNALSGSTTITAGILRVSTSGNLGGIGTVVKLNGGTLDLRNDAGTNFVQNVIVSANSTINVDPAIGDLPTPGQAHTLGMLTMGGNFTLTITSQWGTGANGYSLILGAGTATDAATFTDNAATLTLASLTESNAAAKTLTFNGFGATTVNGGILQAGAGSASVTQSGLGRLVLGGSSTYTGNTSVSNGVFRANDGAGLPSGGTAGNLSLSGSGVWESGADITRALGTGAGQVQLASGITGFSAYGAPINVNLGGGTPITWGTTPGFSPTGTVGLVLNAATANNTINFQNNLTLGGNRTIYVNAAAAYPATISGLVSGANSLTKSGSGALVLSNTGNSYSGGTTVEGGILIAGVDAPSSATGAFGTTAAAIGLGDATTTNVGYSPTLVTSGAVTIGLPVTVNNNATTGTYRIGGLADAVSTFSGLVTLRQPLTVTQAPTTGSNALNITGGITVGNAALNTATFNNAGSVAVGTGAMQNGSGTLAVVKTGSGLLTFTGPNTYSGATTISAGTLQVGDGGSNGSIGLTSGVSIASGAVLAFNRSDDYGGGFAPTISGSGRLDLTSGTLTLSGTNSYGGGTFVKGGELIVNDSFSLPDNGNLTVGDPLAFPAAVVPGEVVANSSAVSPVPEPGTLALLAAGAAAAAVAVRRRRTAR